MWLCEGKLKVKIADFRLPSASQKRACLSSLISRRRPWQQLRFLQLAVLSETAYVAVKSKLQPLPRAFEFLENFVQIPPFRGRKAVQIPPHSTIPGDLLPPPPGNFSVAFIMLRKLCM